MPRRTFLQHLGIGLTTPFGLRTNWEDPWVGRFVSKDANVNVNFTAAHAETRAALEQAMPQLRAVLAGAGLTLGQATVQQQARHESQNSHALARVGSAADEPLDAPITVTRVLGMIDEYV